MTEQNKHKIISSGIGEKKASGRSITALELNCKQHKRRDESMQRLLKLSVINILLLLFSIYLFGCAGVGQTPQQVSDVEGPSGTETTLGSSSAPVAGEGPTFYVSPLGDDSNPGTIDQPWKTVQHAADVLVAGDTVLIRDGVYNEHVEPVNSGNETNGYIVFSAYPDEQPIIDGDGIEIANNGIVIAGKSYFKLLDLEIRNWNDAGILTDAAHHIDISDCEIYEVGGGIEMMNGTHDFELNRVKMHDFTLYGFDASPAEGDPCYNGVFNDCAAYTGRDPDQNVDGFALGHGEQENFTFNRCIVYDVFDGFDMSAKDTMLNRCAVYDCWNAGLKLWQDNIKLTNCLSYHNPTNAYLAWSGEGGLRTVTFQNCIFVDAATFNVWMENSLNGLNMYNSILAGGDNIGLSFEQMGIDNYHGDYNIFHNDNSERTISVGYTDEFTLDQIADAAWTSYSGEDEHSIISTDPNSQLFQNLDDWDFHLLDGGIAIDKGTDKDAPSEDYDGKPRPNGKGYDIGAYEWQP